MTSKGLGEMFEGDSADTCAGKFPLVSMGAEWRVSRAQTRGQGPPSALADIIYIHEAKSGSVYRFKLISFLVLARQ